MGKTFDWERHVSQTGNHNNGPSIQEKEIMVQPALYFSPLFSDLLRYNRNDPDFTAKF